MQRGLTCTAPMWPDVCQCANTTPTIKTIVEHEFPVWSGSRSATPDGTYCESVPLPHPLNKLLLLNPNVSTCFPPPRCCCHYRLAHRLLLFPTPPPHLFIVINMSTIPKYTLFVYLSFHQMVGPPFFVAPSRSRPL